MRKVTILGSTGSIGWQTLDVIRRLPDRFSLFGISALNEIDDIIEQTRLFRPEVVAIADKDSAREIEHALGADSPKILAGKEGIIELASMDGADIIVNSISGSAGLEPTLSAIRRGVRLCMANKESLVIAGRIVMDKVKNEGAELIPIDSEHSALLQASLSGRFNEIKRLILTASGGPFHGKDIDLEKVSVEEALSHPNWRMGPKISIDSATMMNKGLEVIEAHWLFRIPPDRIDVIIHPQSIIHSIVEFIDGSLIAQASVPDMRLPIQYALTYPDRIESPIEPLELSRLRTLTFEEPDFRKFPCLLFAYDALEAGGSAPCAMNSANESAVSLFLAGKISFSMIPRIINKALSEHDIIPEPSVDEILDIDREIRERIFRDFDTKTEKVN